MVSGRGRVANGSWWISVSLSQAPKRRASISSCPTSPSSIRSEKIFSRASSRTRTKITSAPSPRFGRVVGVPALCDAIRRGTDANASAVGAGRAGCSDQYRCAKCDDRPRAVQHRIYSGGAFDPRKFGAGDPHRRRHNSAFRRLEDRSDTDHRLADRREEAPRQRRRGRARAPSKADSTNILRDGESALRKRMSQPLCASSSSRPKAESL